MFYCSCPRELVQELSDTRCLFEYFNMYIFLLYQNGVFMGFSITSAVFGGVTIICYSISIAMYDTRYYRRWREADHDASMAIAALVLILGIVNFASGIWAAVGSCYIASCCGNGAVPAQQVKRQC